MAKKIMKVLDCLAVIMIVIMLGSVIALNNNMPNASAYSPLSADEKVAILQADQEVKFDGTAIEYFSSTGTCSWKVRVEKIVSGPSELQGHTVTVALWSGDSGEFPSGSMDPEVEPGDKVGVYGLCVGEDYVTLSGSEDYYITKSSASNQPSVTVRYPNGGESILTGTQVQVSAHATDEVAVTCVTLYYSCDGGSNWNLIGAGAKVSGTDKDGTWNRTWNTDGLSAGTNHMIKAVASDGTSRSEDQSDDTFSLHATTSGIGGIELLWEFPVDTHIHDIAFGDLNGDRMTDVVASVSDWGSIGWSVVGLKGNSGEVLCYLVASSPAGVMLGW